MAKLLIVDDEGKIRRILAMLLRDAGHEVAEAGSGEQALALTETEAPDLALLDLRLPDMDGLEILGRLRQRQPPVEVLMITAHGTISTAVEAMRRGAFDYLTKPFDNDELILLVHRALDLKRLSAEVDALRDELEARYGFHEIVGISAPIQELFRNMAKVARVDATVLVTGESGTGKELVARAIHRKSPRGERPFVAVNCSAIPESLVEAEFFGHEKGAFTDAKASRPGRFEQAEGGTLFLDEVGDLALDAQAKLLRALQEKQVTRVGGTGTRRLDVRVVAATNKDLEAEVRAGGFREDLYWRLNVVQLRLPALRERREDLPLLLDHFLDRINRELGLTVRHVAPEARRLLVDYDWPGNVRELENTLCRSMVLCEGGTLGVADLPGRLRGETVDGMGIPVSDLDRMTLGAALAEVTERFEKRMILSRLAALRGRRQATAQSLGISRKTLFNKMRLYGLGAEDLGE